MSDFVFVLITGLLWMEMWHRPEWSWFRAVCADWEIKMKIQDSPGYAFEYLMKCLPDAKHRSNKIRLLNKKKEQWVSVKLG